MDLPNAVPEPVQTGRVTFNQILSRSWDIFKKNYRVIVPLVLLLYIPIQIISALSQMSSSLGSKAFIGFVLAVIAFVGPSWVITTVSKVVRDAMNGTTANLKTALYMGRGWLALLGTELIIFLIFLGATLVGVLLGIAVWFVLPLSVRLGALILLGIVVGAVMFYANICLSFVCAIVPLTGVAGVPALRGSYELVKGNWWRVFGYSLLLVLVVMAVSFLSAIPYGLLVAVVGRSEVLALVYGIVTDILASFAFVFTPVFYILLSKEKGAN